MRLPQQMQRQPTARPVPALNRNGERTAILDRLRQCIQRIEGRTTSFTEVHFTGARVPAFEETPQPPAHLENPAPRTPHEDGGCPPRTAPPPAPSSSSLSATLPRTHDQAGASPFRSISPESADRSEPPLWTLGDTTADALAGPKGLDPGGVHEIKPARLQPIETCDDGAIPSASEACADWASAWGAARVFALALIARRMRMLAATGDTTRPALWCQIRASADDLGELYAPGLSAFGIAPERLLMVEVDTARDALWVLEEALRAGSLALVAGAFPDAVHNVGLTPARRLALAAQAHATPCLVLTHPQTQSMAATATRWRIEPLDSAPHVFAGSTTLTAAADAIADRLPGARHLRVGLERSRAQPLAGSVSQARVSWCDETFCFRMAAPVRNRTHGVCAPWRHTA